MKGPRARNSTASAALLAAALVAVLAPGCECGQRTVETAAAPGAVSERFEAPDLSAPAPGPADVPLPPKGEIVIQIMDGRVTVLANRVVRVRILRELAREAHFGVELAFEARVGGKAILRVVDATLEDALAALLQGLPYALFYSVDEAGVRFLARVHVGEGGTPEEIAEVEEPDEQRVARKEPEREPQREEQPSFDAEQAEMLTQLSDADWRVRSEAAEWIYPDAQAVGALGDLILGDSDPRVRASAAEGLGMALKEPGAVDALVLALRDPDSRVVVAALEALEFVGDETTIPELMFLLSHEDPEVRERTVEAVEWLE